MMKKGKKGGFILSAELVMIATIMVIGLLVGMVAMRNQLLAEMKDTAEAIGSLNQSYTFTGWAQLDADDEIMAETAGSEWLDATDDLLHADTVLLIAPPSLTGMQGGPNSEDGSLPLSNP